MAPSNVWDNASAAADDSKDHWGPTAEGAGGWGGGTEYAGGDFAPENISKYANDAASRDGGCRYCHEEGHFARDCPKKEDRPSGCFNCGEEGHNKSECPNPPVEREFTGECRVCGESGHRAKDCAKGVCKICRVEGHNADNCDQNRMHMYFAGLGIEELSPDDAFEALKKVDEVLSEDPKNAEKFEAVKYAVYAYVKSYPATTWVELEETFRELNMQTHLIAKEVEADKVFNVINLQGEVVEHEDGNPHYVVAFELSDKPRRKALAQGWPENAEQNKERLGKAGLLMSSGAIRCTRCHEVGHSSKMCPNKEDGGEPADANAVIGTCANCDSTEHRLRDCPEARKPRGGSCRNCGQAGHKASDCTEPPNMDNVECKVCGETGHFARDCPQKEPEICRNCYQEGHRKNECPNERVMKCRNCDGLGHISKECTEPLNMEKIQCRNCDEFGHFSSKCPQPFDPSKLICSTCKETGHHYKKCPNEGAATGGGGDDFGGGANFSGGGGDAAAGASWGGGASGGANW